MANNLLSISLVLFKPNPIELVETLRSLQRGLIFCGWSYQIIVIDNSPPEYDDSIQRKIVEEHFSPQELNYYRSDKNLGFGVAHNHALMLDGKYHLILNPDLVVKLGAIKNALLFMEDNPQCGLLTPHATWGDGEIQRLCKRYPSVFDLLLRGFAPRCIKTLFHKRLDNYEMVDVLDKHDVYWDPPIVSGCFMLFRTDVWKRLGGFDPRFFLYFEDFDLALRVNKITRVAYVPSVKVIHYGGHASRKGFLHVYMFVRSMISFFNKHGWRLW